MGRALLQGWLSAPPANGLTLSVIDPHGTGGITAPFIQYTPSLNAWSDQTSASADTYVLAVKPQSMAQVCAELASTLPATKPLILSIAAGKTLGFYETFFGVDAPCIRAMPNTPGAIGQGISVYIGNSTCSAQALALGAMLLAPLGPALNLADYGCAEDMMDAVTALSGSGPAYVYALTEAMALAGSALGLPQNLAEKLARRTVEGAAALMAHRGADQSPATLRQAVTSPGGTTEAALAVLAENQAFSGLMAQALQAAANRSKKLSS